MGEKFQWRLGSNGRNVGVEKPSGAYKSGDAIIFIKLLQGGSRGVGGWRN